MTKEETKALADVMLHWVNGGDVEEQYNENNSLAWVYNAEPTWNNYYYRYRKAKPRPKLIHNAVYFFDYEGKENIGIYKDSYTKHFLTNESMEIKANECQNITFYAEPKGDDLK